MVKKVRLPPSPFCNLSREKDEVGRIEVAKGYNNSIIGIHCVCVCVCVCVRACVRVWGRELDGHGCMNM